MTDEPHNAAETEPAGKLPTIVAVHATGPISLRITWSDGIEGELNLTTILADRRFAALRDPAAFTRVGVGEWGRSLGWPSGVGAGADILRLETALATAATGTWW